MWAFCRCLQQEPSPCYCLSCSRKNLLAAWVVLGWRAGVGVGAGAGAGAVVAAEAEAAAAWDFAAPVGNRRGWMWRCSQLNHNLSSWCLRDRAERWQWRHELPGRRKTLKDLGQTWTAGRKQSKRLCWKTREDKCGLEIFCVIARRKSAFATCNNFLFLNIYIFSQIPKTYLPCQFFLTKFQNWIIHGRKPSKK